MEVLLPGRAAATIPVAYKQAMASAAVMAAAATPVWGHLFGGFAGGVRLAWRGSAIRARPRGAHGEVAARADAATLRVQAAVLREAVPLLRPQHAEGFIGC